MNKNKKIILASALSCMFLIGGVCVSCSKNPSTSEQNANYEIVSGLDFAESITVKQGVSVPVDMPLVIDGVGNVLEVSCVVKDKQGNVITLDSNRFFAVSLDGYTVEYVVKKLDGTTETKTQKIYVEGQVAEKRAVLIDINGVSTYDLKESVSATNREKLGSLLGDNSVTWKLIDGYDETKTVATDGSTVSITNVEKRFYRVQMLQGEKTVYTGYVDFYDATESVIWNDMTDASLASVVQCNYNNTATGSDLSGITVTSELDTQTNSYYYTWTLNGYSTEKFAKDFVLQVLPQHSLAYYESLIPQDEWSLYSFAFSYKSELAYAQAVSPVYVDENGIIKGNVTLVNTGEWSDTYSKAANVPTNLDYKDYFLTYYNRLSTTYPIDTVSPYTGWGTRTTQGVIDIYGTQDADGTISLKGFNLVKKYFTGETSLETSLQSQSYNASNIFAQAETFAQLTKNGKLEWTVVDETSAPVAVNGETFTAKVGKTYTVTAKHGDDVIASGTLSVTKKTYTETGLELVDVSQITTLDVTQYVSDTIVTELSESNITWQLAKKNSDKIVTTTSGTLTIANAEKCLYQLQAIDSQGDVVYKGYELDLYNPTDGIVWNDMTDTNLARISGGVDTNASQVSAVNHSDIGQSYYYEKSGEANANIYFYVMPMHSLEYYQMWQTADADYIMTFDFAVGGTGNHYYSYFDNGTSNWTEVKAVIAVNNATTPYYTMNPEFLSSTFGSVTGYSGYTYTLDNIIENYADLSSATSIGHTSAFLISVNNANDRTVYIGNMRFVQQS